MKWKHPVFVALVCAMVGMGQSAVASEPAEEVRQMVDTYIDHADPELTAAALMATAHMGSEDQRDQLEVYKTAVGQQERLATAAALMLTDDAEAVEFTVEQLLGATDTPGALTRLWAYLPEDKLQQVLDAAFDEASPPQQRTILYFMADQTGPIYDVLVQRAMGEDEAIREMAMEALSYTTGEQTLEVAERFSGVGDASIRAQKLDITEALLDRRDLRSTLVSFLGDAVGDSDSDIRRRAARQLVVLGDQRGTEVLSAALVGAESQERIEILEHLLEYGARADIAEIRPLIEEVELDESADRQRERELLYAFAATDVDTELLADLSRKMSSTTFNDRLVALHALGYTRLPEARQLLTGALGEGRSDVRRLSAQGLGQMAEPDSLNDLRSQLTGEGDDEVRLELIHAISQIRDARSVQILQFLRTDRNPEVRLALVEALGALALPESVRSLEHLLQQRDSHIQWRAFVTLLELDSEAAGRHLSTVLRNPPDRFGHDLDPHGMSEEARELVYEAILTHSTSRVRSVGVNHVKSNRDALMPIARKAVVNPDVQEDTRVDLVHIIATENNDEDKSVFERVLRDFSSEAGGLIAAWKLIERGDSDTREIFAEIAEEEEDTPMAIIARLALATLE